MIGDQQELLLSRSTITAPVNWGDICANCEELIRSGQGPRAREILASLTTKNVPRARQQPVAHLMYRVGLHWPALEVLRETVAPQFASSSPATEDELATYAICLVRVGSLGEAEQILASLSDQKPEVDLYRAFAYQSTWDCARALPHLRRYLERPEPTEYERAIAGVNLAACLIDTEQFGEAATQLDALMEKARVERWTLLYKNMQELRGQLAVKADDFDEARRWLSAAARERYRTDDFWDFLIAKWTAIVEVRKNPGQDHYLSLLRQVRSRAESLSHWESIRECDRVLAVATRDTELFLKVYFGTPFASFRARMLKDARGWISAPTEFTYGDASGLVFDLVSGRAAEGEGSLNAGKSLHRTMLALFSDLYRPHFMGTLFTQIFEGERLNPVTVQGRVKNAISRLRGWASEHHYPLRIDSADQSYRIFIDKGAAPFAVRYSEDLTQAAPREDVAMIATLHRLQQNFSEKAFSSVEAADQLHVSKSSVIKVLRWGVENGKLNKEGQHKTIRYRFVA